MKVLFEDVKKQIANAEIGSKVEVLVSNATRRNGSSPFYTRKGVLIEKTDVEIKVLIGGKKYTMRLWHAHEWVGEYPNRVSVATEYANGLFYVRTVAE